MNIIYFRCYILKYAHYLNFPKIKRNHFEALIYNYLTISPLHLKKASDESYGGI